ncbi:hypothetical protein ACFU9O_29595 [Streptomyces albidoflavus]|uniref:Uncharacterized protein n=3 Tax=Streptomyces TaxID=1883 RepID=A0ACC7Y5X4_9ACTN|nr:MULTISPECIES: hypothetical protein [Streptomyces]KPC64596.1 membrane protein [Streptomyces sp. NRRL F-6602]NUW10577.1 hypothetical protein [Streptomyces sp. CAI-21]NVI33103.1 hypothetical protein [Streptomyces sp. CAI-17]QLA57720.1 hypothetical protein HWN34_14855 [Streptomyces violascens]SCE42574.1 hypothetical protein GA0115236_15585 [Streptomyces sp. IgraMP-1]BDH51940.1 membrane protein [Streptomyces albus]
MVQAKKVALYLVVVFVLYVIISDPDTAGDYVTMGFEGISNAASAVGDFMTWIANGGNS